MQEASFVVMTVNGQRSSSPRILKAVADATDQALRSGLDDSAVEAAITRAFVAATDEESVAEPGFRLWWAEQRVAELDGEVTDLLGEVADLRAVARVPSSTAAFAATLA